MSKQSLTVESIVRGVVKLGSFCWVIGLVGRSAGWSLRWLVALLAGWLLGYSDYHEAKVFAVFPTLVRRESLQTMCCVQNSPLVLVGRLS